MVKASTSSVRDSGSLSLFNWKVARRASGVIRVVSRTIATMTATSGFLKIPVLAPMAVTIRPTSPREIMPQPMRMLLTQSIPEARAADPQPTSFPTTATTKTTASSRPVTGERAVIAGEADGNKKQRNQQRVADGGEAALHVGLELGAGENVSQ